MRMTLEAATRAARAYKRRCWWTELDDLEQEATRAVLEARQWFDPAVGVPWRAYSYRAAVLALHRYVLALSAPVSAAINRRPELKGLHRAKLPADAEDRFPDMDDLLDDSQWTTRVRKRVQIVLARAGLEMVEPVLFKERTAAELAEERGLEKKAVQRVAGKARLAVSQDLKLWKMWHPQ